MVGKDFTWELEKACPDLTEGWRAAITNRVIIRNLSCKSWKSLHGGDVQMSDPIAVKERCERYLRFCAEQDSKPSIAGLAFALGIARQNLHEYIHGRLGKNAEVRDTLKKTHTFINSLMEDYMQNGKINPVAGIFLIKNNMGYTDKQEVVVTPNAKFGEEPDQKALEDKYIESIVADDDEAAESSLEG